MTKKDIASVFSEAINKTPGERQLLLDHLSHAERFEIEELLAADQMANDNHLLDSLNFEDKKKQIQDKKPERIRDYQINKLIGEGGMGKVYKAHHSRLKCDFAIKVMSRTDRSDDNDDTARARFDREIAAIGGLRHPNIVQATDAGVDGDINYLVMEFVDGPDVSRVLKANGKLSIANACEIIRQTALGLSHAHARGLIHRDVKPSNLMIATDGTVKLTDMGLALLRDWNSQVSKTSQIMGTLDYIAPEQIDNAKNVDQRSDLYSLGCMFYELLAGATPYAAPEFKTTLQKLNGHGQGVPPDLSIVRPDVPDAVAAIVNRLIAKEPAKRFQTATELAKAIVPFAKGAQVSNLVHETLGMSASAIDTDRIFDRDAVTFQRTPELPASNKIEEKKPSLKFKRIGLGLTLAFGLAVGLALMMNANQIIRIVTNKGTLVIENSEDVEISITQGQLVNRLLDMPCVSQISGFDSSGNHVTLSGSERISAALELSGMALRIKTNTKHATESELEKLWQTSSLLPFEILFYFGNTPSSSSLLAIAKQKNIEHVRFYGNLNFVELDKLPKGSFAHANVLMLSGLLPVDKVELLASHFPNISRLNVDVFDYERIETLKRFPLDHLIVQIKTSQQLPSLDTHTKLKILSVVYSSSFQQEPKLNCAHLPPDIHELNIQNASLTIEHVKQLNRYEHLSSVDIVFSDTCVRKPLDMSDAIAELKKLRPDIYFNTPSHSSAAPIQYLNLVKHPTAKDTGMDWLAQHASDLKLLTPHKVDSVTDDLWKPISLIDGSGLNCSSESIETLAKEKHCYSAYGGSWVTEFSGINLDYFANRNALNPELTFTLKKPETIEAMMYWGYVFTEAADASSNEPKKFKFTFFDSAGKQIGKPIHKEVSAPIRISARVIPLPSIQEVTSIEIELTDNFNIPNLPGNRVGMSEVRFLGSKK